MTRPYNQIPLKKDLNEVINIAYNIMFKTGQIRYVGKTPLRHGQSFLITLEVIPTKIPMPKPKLVKRKRN